jgi:Recombination endonuclease VII
LWKRKAPLELLSPSRRDALPTTEETVTQEEEFEDEFNVPVEEVLQRTAKPKRRKKWGGKYPRHECSPEDRGALMEFQEGKCAVCGSEEKLHLDHSRRNGRTRGLL